MTDKNKSDGVWLAWCITFLCISVLANAWLMGGLWGMYKTATERGHGHWEHADGSPIGRFVWDGIPDE